MWFGLSYDSILEFKKQYLIAGGPLKITPYSIKKAFREKKFYNKKSVYVGVYNKNKKLNKRKMI